MDMESKLVIARGDEGAKGMDGEFGVGRQKVLHLECINNEVLLYSTGNYIQSLGQTMMENNIKKNVYMYITESLCCTAEIGTML